MSISYAKWGRSYCWKCVPYYSLHVPTNSIHFFVTACSAENCDCLTWIDDFIEWMCIGRLQFDSSIQQKQRRNTLTCRYESLSFVNIQRKIQMMEACNTWYSVLINQLICMRKMRLFAIKLPNFFHVAVFEIEIIN